MKVWVSNQFIGSFVTTKQISKDNVQKALTQFFVITFKQSHLYFIQN